MTIAIRIIANIITTGTSGEPSADQIKLQCDTNIYSSWLTFWPAFGIVRLARGEASSDRSLFPIRVKASRYTNSIGHVVLRGGGRVAWDRGTLVRVLSTKRLNYAAENCEVIKKIVAVLGLPEHTWPEWQAVRKIAHTHTHTHYIQKHVGRVEQSFQNHLKSDAAPRPLRQWPEAVELIASVVVWNPEMRPSAGECLRHSMWGVAEEEKTTPPRRTCSTPGSTPTKQTSPRSETEQQGTEAARQPNKH